MTVSIYLGDWRDVFESWPVGTMVCDPPYGVGWRRTDARSWRNQETFTRRPSRSEGPTIRGDKTTRERDEAMATIRWSAAAVFGPHRIDRVKPWCRPGKTVRQGGPRDILFWDKGEGVGAGDTTLPWKPCVETIAIYGAGWRGHRGSSVLRGGKIAFSSDTVSNGRMHPNEKPLSVVRELVEKSPPGPILDPFMGSGVVGAACMLLGRDYFGAEIDPAYFAIASDRIGVTNGPLFEVCS